MLGKFGKRGEVGETITWIVATVAIIVILLISVFVSSFYFGGNKKIPGLQGADYLAVESFFSWLLTKDSSGISVYEQIKSAEAENLNEFNGNLALSIFKEFYGREYFQVWVGINFEGFGARQNSYFNTMPIDLRGGDIGLRVVPLIVEEIFLNENKIIELVLAPK